MNIVSHHVRTTLCGRCIDVVLTLWTLYRRWNDVFLTLWTLYRRCPNVMYGRCIDVGTTLSTYRDQRVKNTLSFLSIHIVFCFTGESERWLSSWLGVDCSTHIRINNARFSSGNRLNREVKQTLLGTVQLCAASQEENTSTVSYAEIIRVITAAADTVLCKLCYTIDWESSIWKIGNWDSRELVWMTLSSHIPILRIFFLLVNMCKVSIYIEFEKRGWMFAKDDLRKNKCLMQCVHPARTFWIKFISNILTFHPCSISRFCQYSTIRNEIIHTCSSLVNIGIISLTISYPCFWD